MMHVYIYIYIHMYIYTKLCVRFFWMHINPLLPGLLQRLQCHLRQVMFGLTGIFSLYLGSFAEHLSSYLTASFLQSLLNAAALILLNVLYFEPLEQCAGLAASFEILAQDFLPCFYSMICTQSLIHSGVESYMDLQSVSFVAAPVFYLGYELVSRRPANCQRSDAHS